MFGFGKKRERALEGALEEEVSGRIREKVLNADTQEALALLAEEREKESQESGKENKRLRELSTKDELTEVLNRRGFKEEIKRITSAMPSEEAGQPERKEGFRHLTLLLLDIDYFKRYNDELGHDAGDEILKKVARHLAVKLRIRTSDFVARLGGEEFVIAFPGASEQEVLEKLSELRTEIGEQGKTGIKFTEFVRNMPMNVHMSCGISSYRPGEDIEDTIKRADQALYFAKEHGRDQAHVFDPKTMAGLNPRGEKEEKG